MGLFDKGWQNKDKEKALKWIAKHKGTDMIDAITTSKDQEIRQAAMDRLAYQIDTMKYDEELMITYFDLLNRNCDYATTKYIVSKINDQGFLKKLAQKGCQQAVEAISDQDILFEMLTDRQFYKDNSLLCSYGRDECRKRMRPASDTIFVEAASDHFHDLSKMTELLKRTPYERAAVKAAVAVRNNQLADLKEIALNPVNSFLARKYAIFVLNEEKDILEVIDKIENQNLKCQAIEKIETPEIRKRFCETDGTHKWKQIDTIHHEVGDHDYMDHIYECVYCGAKKSEHETYVY